MAAENKSMRERGWGRLSVGAARLPAEADRGSTGRPWTGLSATALPFLVVLLPTFQKGDLAKQQPVYQGRVGEGGQGDGAEPGAKEGLGLRVGRGLAIDCDGQGCEDEERDLGRRELAGEWAQPLATASSISHNLQPSRGRASKQAGGQKL